MGHTESNILAASSVNKREERMKPSEKLSPPECAGSTVKGKMLIQEESRVRSIRPPSAADKNHIQY